MHTEYSHGVFITVSPPEMGVYVNKGIRKPFEGVAHRELRVRSKGEMSEKMVSLKVSDHVDNFVLPVSSAYLALPPKWPVDAFKCDCSRTA